MFTLRCAQSATFDANISDMKKILSIALIFVGLAAMAQVRPKPSFEIGVGYALRHTEGFGIPKAFLGVNNLYNGIGAYVSPEYRGNITFLEDGTDYYFRIPMGLTFQINENAGLFAGIDPISFAMGKNLRKEIGLSFNTGPLTIRTGYSYWVGATIGVGLNFGGNAEPISFQSKRPKKAAKSMLPAEKIVETVIRQVDTVVVTKEVIKEVQVEVIREIERDENLVLLTKVYFRDNSIQYVPESFQRIQEIADAVKANASSTIVIIGHTDPRGNEAYNFNLGMERAQRFANDLVLKYGIPAQSVEVRSFGKAEPVSEDNSQNRRVEIFLKK